MIFLPYFLRCTKYDIEIRFADDMDGWVDDGEFPAPGLGQHTYWRQQIKGYDGWQDPDQLAVKMFYLFGWAGLPLPKMDVGGTDQPLVVYWRNGSIRK